jgi:predicted alpha/beta hydrolase
VRKPARLHFDLCVTTLFLHHFDDQPLRDILAAVAARADVFLACEPRRDVLARWGSRLVGLLGANPVTRADAKSSVAAGFSGTELTRHWPASAHRWALAESHVLPFTHLFLAQALATGAAMAPP